MSSRSKEHQIHRGEGGILGPRRKQIQQVGEAWHPQGQETPPQCIVQGIQSSEACPGMPPDPTVLVDRAMPDPGPLLTLVVAVCVTGIDKLLQAVCLSGDLQEQRDGVILPVVQVEHGFQQTGFPRLRVCRTK